MANLRFGSRRKLSPEGGLDWLNLFVANIQTGFGPFISVYLTAHGWTQTAIGLALSLGTLTAMASQLPAGALVDAIDRKSRVAAFSLIAFTASALLLAVAPLPLFVYLAEILHGFSSCTLGPAIAALSIIFAGSAGLGLRLGRNTRFSSIGNGVGAALMGACGYLVSDRAVFFLTAVLTVPALLAIIPLSGAELKRKHVPSSGHESESDSRKAPLIRTLLQPKLLIFAGSAALFTLANAAMLPLAGSMLTMRAGSFASLLIAGAIVLPQAIVALISPAVGRLAESRGRRFVLIVGFAMLPIRGLLLATIQHPASILAVQAFDGIAAACFGVMVPLVTADLTRSSGRFNASLGFVGFAIGIGGTISTGVAGWLGDRHGLPFALGALAVCGVVALLTVVCFMPETRPQADRAPPRTSAVGGPASADQAIRTPARQR